MLGCNCLVSFTAFILSSNFFITECVCVWFFIFDFDITQRRKLHVPLCKCRITCDECKMCILLHFGRRPLHKATSLYVYTWQKHTHGFLLGMRSFESIARQYVKFVIDQITLRLVSRELHFQFGAVCCCRVLWHPGSNKYIVANVLMN